MYCWLKLSVFVNEGRESHQALDCGRDWVTSCRFSGFKSQVCGNESEDVTWYVRSLFWWWRGDELVGGRKSVDMEGLDTWCCARAGFNCSSPLGRSVLHEV